MIRRWRSFDRRNKTKHPTLERRTEDLAKALRDSVEPDSHMVGRIMGEYRSMAERLAAVLHEL